MQEGTLHLRALHRPDYGGICADWQSAEMLSRIRAGKKQLLARACGLTKLWSPSILDATAGLGRDGYTLHRLGAQVTLCERHPLIFQLLEDARRRAAAQELELLQASAATLLASGRRWDVVYLDPMYPDKTKSSLPGKEMQIFRDLTGGDADADALLEPALRAARKRVVVKRPRHAPQLAGREPQLSMQGNLARFDIYFCHSERSEESSGL